MASKNDNRLAWGITLLVFGVLFLIRQLDIFSSPIQDIIFNIKNIPIIMGLIFLFFHSNKNIGAVLIVVGLLLRFPDIIRITKNFSNYLWPSLLIVAGLIVILTRKK